MRERSGMTLAEVVVLVVAAILVLVFAVPQWRAYQKREHTVAMRDALQRLAMAEDSYFYDFGTYTDVLAPLEARGYRAGSGVQIRLIEATRVGWSASASHARSPVECHVFVKTAAPVGPATEEGEIACG